MNRTLLLQTIWTTWKLKWREGNFIDVYLVTKMYYFLNPCGIAYIHENLFSSILTNFMSLASLN
jgi:hypothetical protein